MTDRKYLLAAEADRIQDLLFRSSRLREVVGGSALVDQFCSNVRTGLGLPEEQMLVCDGGAFRLLLDSEEQCRVIASKIANDYFAETGGTLSVASDFPECDPKDKVSFQAANRAAQTSLRRAKAVRGSTSGVAHLPLVGVCASCGSGLAIEFAGLPDVENEPPNYRCRPCRNKADKERRLNFLKGFAKEVGGNKKNCTFKPEQIGQLDARGYVAYLKADGNAFGELFDSCNSAAQLKQLSDELTTRMWRSLKLPGKSLFQVLNDRHRSQSRNLNHIPILPLIVAGDECLMLLPAPPALDYTKQFCRVFEAEMNPLIEELELSEAKPPTLSAAVVFCKANYPHKLAHRRADKLLATTKRVYRQLTPSSSLVSFEVVKGSSALTDDEREENDCWATAQPYCVATDDNSRDLLLLGELIAARHGLNRLPNTRRNELRDLFDAAPQAEEQAIRDWHDEVERVLQRIERMDATRREENRVSAELRAVLYDQFGFPGEGDERPPRLFKQITRDGESRQMSGFGDLLEVWRFCERIDIKTPARTEVPE